VVALALLVIGFWPTLCTGTGLFSGTKARQVMGVPGDKGGLAGTAMAGTPDAPPIWKEGDVVLMRSGLVESDFLRSEIPEATRPQVERVLVAPLTLLYPDSSHKPVIALTLSHYRNNKIKTMAADPELVNTFYNADLVARLKKYDRYWMTGVAPRDTPNTWYYLSCVVPWLATHLERGDLVVSRDRDGPEHYVVVKPGLGLDEPIKGLTEDVKIPQDYGRELHIVRRPPEPQK